MFEASYYPLNRCVLCRKKHKCCARYCSAHLQFPLELSRDITENSPLWELLPFQPFLKSYWLTPVKWLANCCEVCTSHANTGKLRGSIKCGARDNYVRIFSFTLLNNLDLWLINYYSSQSRFAHQRAVSVWPLLCSVQVSMMFFLQMSPSALDQRWTWTLVMSSCRLNVRIPLTHRTCRTGHQPGFSRPPSMAERRAECRYRS